VGAALIFPTAGRADQARTDGPALGGQPCEVVESQDIRYYEPAKDAHADRHKLDVYRPKGKKDCPVVLFVHGGGWVLGSKEGFCGLPLNRPIGRCLARQGLVAVLPNYRLAPAVQHPGQVEDVARAFAWTCKNIRRYGGRPDQVFLAGHSAGGHLVALLAADETYLKAVGRRRQDIKGVIAVSGVYRLGRLKFQATLRDPFGVLTAHLKFSPLAPVFGNDPKAWEKASPVTHVQRGLPPFLLVNAGFDLGPLRAMTREFAEALKDKGCDVRVKSIAWRTHETVMYHPFSGAEPATIKALVQFVGDCVR
jgi:acetyl esterase/lipase